MADVETDELWHGSSHKVDETRQAPPRILEIMVSVVEPQAQLRHPTQDSACYQMFRMAATDVQLLQLPAATQSCTAQDTCKCDVTPT